MGKYLAFKDFVETALINELSSLMAEGSNDTPTNNIKYRYHAFILIAVGIETLGAALDKHSGIMKRLGQKRDLIKHYPTISL